MRTVWRKEVYQRGRRGLLPSTTVTINNEDGNPLSDEQQRWRRHLSTVLNVQSQFEREELEKVRQRPLRLDLARKPSTGELTTALGKLKSSKAAGSSNILPEVIKTACGSEEFTALLLNLTHTVWEERQVPREWADAILVPIPKKGNLRNCDNWRGIALLDVVGKVVARRGCNRWLKRNCLNPNVGSAKAEAVRTCSSLSASLWRRPLNTGPSSSLTSRWHTTRSLVLPCGTLWRSWASLTASSTSFGHSTSA